MWEQRIDYRKVKNIRCLWCGAPLTRANCFARDDDEFMGIEAECKACPKKLSIFALEIDNRMPPPPLGSMQPSPVPQQETTDA